MKNRYLKYLSSFLSLLITGLILISSFIIYFNNSLGWFVNSKNLSLSGQSTKISETEKITAEYKAYTYNAREEQLHINTGSLENASFINIVNNEGFLELLPYDTIFKARNKYTVALINIKLSNIHLTNGIVHVTLNKSINESINESINSLNGAYVTSKMKFYLIKEFDQNTSILINQSNKSISQDNDELASIFSTIYYFVNDENTTASSFVSGQTEADYIDMQTSFSSTDLVNNLLSLFIYVFYDEEAAEATVAQGIDSSTTIIGQEVTVENNLSTLTITIEGTQE